MSRTRMGLLITGAICALAGNAAAADLHSTAQPWFLHVGPGELIYNESATLTVGGQPVPGANVKIGSDTTLIGEIGYYFTPNVALSFTGGTPPVIKVQGAGSLQAAGTLGKAVAGPAALTATYHVDLPGGMNMIRPYIGAGPAYMYVFKNENGAVSNVDVHNAWGFAVQAGTDIMLSEHAGLFFDVKKGWLRTNATGSEGPYPVTAHVVLDPVVLNAGLALRF